MRIAVGSLMSAMGRLRTLGPATRDRAVQSAAGKSTTGFRGGSYASLSVVVEHVSNVYDQACAGVEGTLHAFIRVLDIQIE